MKTLLLLLPAVLSYLTMPLRKYHSLSDLPFPSNTHPGVFLQSSSILLSNYFNVSSTSDAVLWKAASRHSASRL